MSRRSFSAAINRGLRAAAAAERAHARAHVARLRELERQQKARIKLAKEMYVGNKMQEVEEINFDIANQVRAIEHLLTDVLSQSGDVSASTLCREATEASLDSDPSLVIGDAPSFDSFKPPALGWINSLFKKARSAHLDLETKAHREYLAAQSAREERIERRRVAFEALKAEVDAHNEQVENFFEATEAGDPESIVTYSDFLLSTTALPEGFPKIFKIGFLPSSMQLVVEFELPEMCSAVPEDESCRYVKSTDQISVKKRPEKSRRDLYTSAVAQLTLAFLGRIFQSKRISNVESLALSGFVETADPSTGQLIRPCLITVRASRSEFNGFDLERVDPIACLKRLSASVSRSPSELVAVKPVIDFNMVDSRFVPEEDILSTLDVRPNLMELTPSEFESLITNLFQSMGLETKLTQASRDGGVDCVAFDPRPVLGGKVVVQAKRYKNTVGVSAVRDLFGTMHNEGASKGILVTTSGFGRAAFEFANGKPMELLSGENLLYLLKAHANIEAKIIFPDDWREPSHSAEE